jgi:hypothetical protein
MKRKPAGAEAQFIGYSSRKERKDTKNAKEEKGGRVVVK